LNVNAQVFDTDPVDGAPAQARLEAVAQACQKLNAYADEGVLKLSYQKGATALTISADVPLRFLRSERMVWGTAVTGMAAD